MTVIAGSEKSFQTIGEHTPDLVIYSRLFKTHQIKLLNYARKLFRTLQDAEDAVSDAYLRCAPKWGHSCRKNNFTSYVYRAINNLAIDYYRKRIGLQLEAGLGVIDRSSLMDFAEIEDGSAMAKLIESLQEEHQAPIILCDLQELSARVAADVLGISVPALKSRLYRGREALRLQIGDPEIWIRHNKPVVKYIPAEKKAKRT